MSKAVLEKKVSSYQEPFPYTSFEDLPIYEQRYLPRWEIYRQGYYRLKNKSAMIKTRIRDLSPTGVCLCVSPVINTHQILKLKINLSKKISFEAAGTVVWKRMKSDRLCFAGVTFDHLPQQIHDLILKHAFEFENDLLGYISDKEEDSFFHLAKNDRT